MYDAPVDTRPYIEVDEERPEALRDMVRAVTFTEQEGGLASVEMRLDNVLNHAGVGVNYAFEFSDTETLPLGKAFRILFPERAPGEDSTPREIFRGNVSGLEFGADSDGFAELCIFGEDALMGWRMCRHTRNFEGQTIKDMIAALAEGTSLANPTFDYLADEIVARHQVNESDLSFLRRVILDWDADAQVVADDLQVFPRADLEREALTLELGTSLTSVRIMADLADQRRVRSLSAYDQIAGTSIYKEMDLSALGPGEGRTGSEYLESFGDAVEHFSAAPVTNDTEARAFLNGVGARSVRKFVVARGVAVGNPRLRVGTHVTLEGIGPRFANTYYVTSTRHDYAKTSGYVTEFEAECAYFKGEIAT